MMCSTILYNLQNYATSGSVAVALKIGWMCHCCSSTMSTDQPTSIAVFLPQLDRRPAAKIGNLPEAGPTGYILLEEQTKQCEKAEQDTTFTYIYKQDVAGDL